MGKTNHYRHTPQGANHFGSSANGTERAIALSDRELFGPSGLPFVAADQTHISPSGVVTTECAKVIFCVGGWAQIACASGSLSVGRGTVAIISPGLPCWGVPRGHTRTVTAYIQQDYLRQSLLLLSAPHPLVHGLRRSIEDSPGIGHLQLPEGANAGLIRRLNRLTYFTGRRQHEFALLASAADLFDFVGSAAGSGGALEGAPRTIPGRAVAAAITLMEADPAHAWSIEEVAQKVTISSSQLSRMFRRDMGISPAAYLARLRVDRMAELLSTHHIDIAGAAREAGWNSPTIASRAFKRRFGVAPRTFAASYRDNLLSDVMAS